jgi:hypothetical protein
MPMSASAKPANGKPSMNAMNTTLGGKMNIKSTSKMARDQRLVYQAIIALIHEDKDVQAVLLQALGLNPEREKDREYLEELLASITGGPNAAF